MQIYLEKMMEQLNSGETNIIFRNISCICHHWSDDKWKKSMAGGGGNRIIYHVGCAINKHSIISSGVIPGAQSLSKRQTVFFLPGDLMDKNHMDPDVIDLSVPRHAQYLHKAWRRHQDAGCWVDINLVQENRPVPRRSKHVPLMKAQTSTVETKQFMTERRKPVVGRGASHEPGNDQAMLNEVDTDFRIRGLPHSVVKKAQNSRVRELVKKIENHPHRHALQRDIQQKNLQTVQCGVKANGSGRGQRRPV